MNTLVNANELTKTEITPKHRHHPALKQPEQKPEYSSYEAPTLRQFLWIVSVFAILIALSWIAYHKLRWL